MLFAEDQAIFSVPNVNNLTQLTKIQNLNIYIFRYRVDVGMNCYLLELDILMINF